MSTLSGEATTGPQVKTTYWRVGGRVRSVEYTEIDGFAVTEGCLIIDEVSRVERSMQQIRANPKVLQADQQTLGSVIVGDQFRWADATLLYEIDEDLPDKSRVYEAIAHWRDKTGITFQQRDASNRHLIQNYVRFRNGTVCASHVGQRGGAQSLILGPNCSVGNAIHEIGHALGLWHEQCRNDRDAHVRIIWDNIREGAKHNFYQKLNDGEDVSDYDFGSIMHYGESFFSRNNLPTIEVIDPANGPIGQRDGLSAGDIATVKRIYGLP